MLTAGTAAFAGQKIDVRVIDRRGLDTGARSPVGGARITLTNTKDKTVTGAGRTGGDGHGVVEVPRAGIYKIEIRIETRKGSKIWTSTWPLSDDKAVRVTLTTDSFFPLGTKKPRTCAAPLRRAELTDIRDGLTHRITDLQLNINRLAASADGDVSRALKNLPPPTVDLLKSDLARAKTAKAKQKVLSGHNSELNALIKIAGTNNRPVRTALSEAIRYLQYAWYRYRAIAEDKKPDMSRAKAGLKGCNDMLDPPARTAGPPAQVHDKKLSRGGDRQLPYARISGPVDLKDCGYFKLSTPAQRFGRAESLCKGLAGGFAVDTRNFCAFLASGRYVRSKREPSGWHKRVPAWRGNAPVCLHSSSYTSRTVSSPMPLFTVCMHYWFRALGYADSGVKGGTGVYPVIARRHGELPLALFRYVGRSLTCFYLSREQFAKLRNKPEISFLTGREGRFKPVRTIPYFVPVYVQLVFRVERPESSRKIEIKVPGRSITLRADKTSARIFRSTSPFILVPRDDAQGVRP
jgi:hypothetical protein